MWQRFGYQRLGRFGDVFQRRVNRDEETDDRCEPKREKMKQALWSWGVEKRRWTMSCAPSLGGTENL